MNLEALNLIVEGQGLRNILDDTKSGYLSKCKIMTELLHKDPRIREKSIVVDGDGIGVKHTGEASKVYRLIFPLTVDVGKLLFALLSVDDTTLPRKRSAAATIDPTTEGDTVIDDRNPSANSVTVFV